MLSVWRLSFVLCVILLLSCSEKTTPARLITLTPSTILHADFNRQGQLAIGTLTQVAVYSIDGELLHLLDLPRAQASWLPIWLKPDLIAIKDDGEFLFWHPGAGVTAGPWQPREQAINGFFNLSGRLLLSYADGTRVLQSMPVSSTSEIAIPEFNQLPAATAPLRKAISVDGKYLYSAYAGGMITAEDLQTGQPLWHQQLDQGEFVRALVVGTERLSIILQETADPFARGGGQKVIQMGLKSGKVIQVTPLMIPSQAVNALTDHPYMYIGGSENCVFVVDEQTRSVPLCYPPPRRWGEDSGQVIALYQNADKVVAVTSSGYLQIWLKHDIVSLITDK